jgi:hypothetical protein
MAKNTETDFMKWVDRQLRLDPNLEREVDRLVNEMKLEQEIVAGRERRRKSPSSPARGRLHRRGQSRS